MTEFGMKLFKSKFEDLPKSFTDEFGKSWTYVAHICFKTYGDLHDIRLRRDNLDKLTIWEGGDVELVEKLADEGYYTQFNIHDVLKITIYPAK